MRLELPPGVLEMRARGEDWAAWVDQFTMGRHLGYGNHTWDANGLLSSLPSIVTLQAGVMAAWILEAGLTAAATRRLVLTGAAGVILFSYDSLTAPPNGAGSVSELGRAAFGVGSAPE